MDKDMVQKVANTFSCPKAEKDGPCRNNFQDNRYGKGKRIFTLVAGKTVGTKRCTVCTTVV